MGGKGVEPLRTFVHTVLSRTRLPIPPPAQLQICYHIAPCFGKEKQPRFNPGYTAEK